MGEREDSPKPRSRQEKVKGIGWNEGVSAKSEGVFGKGKLLDKGKGKAMFERVSGSVKVLDKENVVVFGFPFYLLYSIGNFIGVNDEFDAYIVVSFASVTLVLSIGETIEEVTDSGFLDTKPSLAISLIGNDFPMQVHPSGIRHVREDGRINEWRTPGKKTIVKVGYNRLQAVIELSGRELIYFELDMTGQLMEVEKHEMLGDVACFDISLVPKGRQRSRFLAVGSYDSTILILSLDPDDCMQVLSIQSVFSPPLSLLFLELLVSIGGEDGADHPASLFLNASLQNGVLFRTVVDMATGQLSDSRSRFLGLRAPKLFLVIVRGQHTMLCLSSWSWLGYVHQGQYLLTPLTIGTLEFAATFSSDNCAEGVVAIAEWYFTSSWYCKIASFHYCKYRRDENQLYIFADDFFLRWLTASQHVDFDAMAGADKFGNVYFVRMPQDVSDEIEEDPPGGKIEWEQGKLNGAPNKLEEIVQFDVGDVVSTLSKASLTPGGGECIIYGTVTGSLGAFLPFTSRADVDFFSHLEMHIRQEHPPLCGRDHMAHRSAYVPVKDVIDCDLCDQFPTLPLDL
uniref:Cleavage/polyadenylation specificity factor A subunit N-terminal domain-containing protein n=1 Tax=Chenopodium quinoa TaxID=63459 RepID=A0A803KUA8_CHEQI